MKAQKTGHIIFSLLVMNSLILIGGCDIDFGSDGDNGGNLSTEAVLSGQIVEISPSRDLDGIIVELDDEHSGSIYEDTTSASGFFEVIGGFCGTTFISFVDEDDETLADTSLNLFPGADTDLGGIIISSGIVEFEEDILVEFIGDVVENDCDGNEGSIRVEIDHDCDNNVEVLVNVDNSTDITRDDNDIDCDEIDIGDEVMIDSVRLTGSTVDAFDIEIIDD